MGDLVQMRDFKRKEEREAADVRLAARPGMAELIADSWAEIAPSEMPPPVWPNFTEKDPA